MSDPFAPALAVANAVLYEGYLLYPYTASATKNRVRWQFGVVVPRRYLRAGTGESAHAQTEVVLESHGEDPAVTVRLRFLQVEARRIEAFVDGAYVPVESLSLDGTTLLTFDEAVEREITVDAAVASEDELTVPIALEGGIDEEVLRDAAGATCGRVIRERWPLRGQLSIRSVPAGNSALRTVRVRIENDSTVVAGERAGALRTAFVSTHVLLVARGGAFVSVLDPIAAAAGATAALTNRQLFPVLVGDATADTQRSTLVLASPIILYDFPAVAPQTDSDAFDATEVDELLTLSVLSMPDAERDEARATDPRARAIIERAERFGAHDLARVHAGQMHRVENAPADLFAGVDPFADVDVPGLDCVFVDGKKVAKGSAVRLRPKRRADSWDMFLKDKIATVRAIHQDLEDVMYVAVTVDDDPASDLHEWYGRSFFFSPDEIEPLEAAT